MVSSEVVAAVNQLLNTNTSIIAALRTSGLENDFRRIFTDRTIYPTFANALGCIIRANSVDSGAKWTAENLRKEIDSAVNDYKIKFLKSLQNWRKGSQRAMLESLGDVRM